jgi:hypothetical protein
MSTIVSAGALTLAEWAKRSSSPVEKGLVNNIYRTSNPIKYLKLADRGVMLASKVERLTNAGLGTVTWVDLGEDGNQYVAGTEFTAEQAFILRDEISCDHLLMQQVPPPVNDPLDIRMQGYAESLYFELCDTFFNNAPSSDTTRKKWTGIRYRIQNASQYKVNSLCDVNGGGTASDLTSAGTTTTVSYFLMKLDELLAGMGNEDGTDCVAFLDGDPYRNMVRLMRMSGQLNQMKDNYDRTIITYKNLKFVNTGYKQDRTTKIIRTNESAAGVDDASSTFTSVFVVDFGRFKGWKFGGFEPLWAGWDKSQGYKYRAFFELGVGLAPQTDNCFGRLFNVKAS